MLTLQFELDPAIPNYRPNRGRIAAVDIKTNRAEIFIECWYIRAWIMNFAV